MGNAKSVKENAYLEYPKDFKPDPKSEEIKKTIQAKLKCDVVIPNNKEEYDAVRLNRFYNFADVGMPLCFIQVTSPEDVSETIKMLAEMKIEYCLCSGGHGAKACVTGVAVIDFCKYNKVEVDAEKMIAHVQAGAKLGALDKACEKHGIFTPTGSNPDTGVSGLTLSGGWGWASRKHGLAVENMVSVDVVLADGTITTASEEKNKDFILGYTRGGW
eukprot:UN31804